MRISILKYVLFSIIICFFEYAPNELCLERDVINFRNNRILADADNRFDLNSFYQSTLSLANQLNDYNDDDEEIIYIRNAINSQIKKHKESNTLPDLNNVDKKTKKLIGELRKELEEVKKELDNKRNSEIAIQPIQDKRITKKDENISVSEYEDFNKLENEENFLESEDDNFEDEYNKIKSSNNYKKFKINGKIKKHEKKLFKKMMIFMVSQFLIVVSGAWYLGILFIPYTFSIIKKCWKLLNFRFKLEKLPR
ncbi:fam-b protein [Plasmodium yoelii]|uniref:Fam-b protein n=2 Tax=Plasmodium yoelii TaxID=5861 RepID=A0AAE9WTA5_PLAYO|nr:fam-b protein [Plasmodium yoelii]WBY56194.1 fam-b protein [Plasmodium yoelii yoelii]VTZ76143.1 fam-b protein [Plasmodium yoelii]|eukprot:XP_022810988.1 fam-b protein [Plasmodium yoelii]